MIIIIINIKIFNFLDKIIIYKYYITAIWLTIALTAKL